MKLRTLIAYFSRRGSNYANGRIVDLPVGNTEVVAHIIHEHTGGEEFRITPVAQHPSDYTEMTQVSSMELRKNARPDLSENVRDMGAFDVIYLGYPNWWGTMPMVVFTFLESHDFSGKTIVPFCTHEGGGKGSSESDIEALCPHAAVLPGLALWGSRVDRAGDEIASWLGRVAEQIEALTARRLE
jgi:flavodoxin